MRLFSNKALVSLVAMLMCTTIVEATPAFARQMDTSCMTCHTQNIPKLNSFGRDFKLSGFTMTGGVKEITDKANGGFSLPGNLNIGFVIKARLHDNGSDEMLTEIFDESAFIFGGKIADNVGTSMEFGAGLLGGKVAFTEVYDFGRIGATYFMTDALGAFSGTEVYSTGLYRPIRQFENRKKANIFQKLGIGSGAATGVQAYYSGNGVYATVGQYTPTFGASTETGSNYKAIARIAYELNMAGFNIALGGYYLGGDLSSDQLRLEGQKTEDIDVNTLDRKSTGLDLQIEGNVADMSLMITAGYILSNTYSKENNATQAMDETGFSIAAQLNPIEVIGVKVAVLQYNDNTDSNKDELIYSIGTDYNFRQNVRFSLEYSYSTYSDTTKDKTSDIIFMSMIAF